MQAAAALDPLKYLDLSGKKYLAQAFAKSASMTLESPADEQGKKEERGKQMRAISGFTKKKILTRERIGEA